MSKRPRRERTDETLQGVVAGFLSAVQAMVTRKHRSNFSPGSDPAPGSNLPPADDDDGLAGSRVPRRPHGLSGSGAAVAILPDE